MIRKRAKRAIIARLAHIPFDYSQQGAFVESHPFDFAQGRLLRTDSTRKDGAPGLSDMG